MTTAKTQERREARKRGLCVELARHDVLRDALGSAYGRGLITFTDLCIARNELRCAWEALRASRVRTSKNPFRPGEEVAVGPERAKVTNVNPTRTVITVRVEGRGEGCYRFTRRGDNTWRNGQFMHPLTWCNPA